MRYPCGKATAFGLRGIFPASTSRSAIQPVMSATTIESSDEKQHPFPADERRENQRERKRIPRAGNEKRERLAERRAAFVEAHADHQDAVVAQIQQHPRTHRAEQSGHAAAAAEDRRHQLARQTPDHRHRHDSEQQSPPRAAQQFITGVAEHMQPPRRGGHREMHRHTCQKQHQRSPQQEIRPALSRHRRSTNRPPPPASARNTMAAPLARTDGGVSFNSERRSASRSRSFPAAVWNNNRTSLRADPKLRIRRCPIPAGLRWQVPAACFMNPAVNPALETLMLAFSSENGLSVPARALFLGARAASRAGALAGDHRLAAAQTQGGCLG